MSPEDIALIASAAASVVLALFTAFIVRLTKKTLKEHQRATELQRELSEKHFRIATIPHMYCQLEVHDGKAALELCNLGTVPAYDVDVLCIGVQDERALAIGDFLSSAETHRKVELAADEEGLYGIYDHFRYSVIPFEKKISAQLNFPFLSQSFYVLLQYRSFLGENYSQLYWFYEDVATPEFSIFRLGSLDPVVISASQRVSLNFDGSSGKKLTTEGGPLPAHAGGVFARMIEHAVPAAFMMSTPTATEDRGTFKNL